MAEHMQKIAEQMKSVGSNQEDQSELAFKNLGTQMKTAFASITNSPVFKRAGINDEVIKELERTIREGANGMAKTDNIEAMDNAIKHLTQMVQHQDGDSEQVGREKERLDRLIQSYTQASSYMYSHVEGKEMAYEAGAMAAQFAKVGSQIRGIEAAHK
jgi:HAMP domain-containing protein